MSNQQNYSSVFANPWAILGLFCLFLICNYYGFLSIAVFCLFICVLCLCSYLWGQHALKNVIMQIQGENSFVFPGDKLPVSFIIQNQKILPLIWLEASVQADAYQCMVPDDSFQSETHLDPITGEEYLFWKKKFAWISWHQKLEWKTNFIALRRGIYF